MNRALVFKSVDARKQNPQNKPGKFTVKFIPELFLGKQQTALFSS